MNFMLEVIELQNVHNQDCKERVVPVLQCWQGMLRWLKNGLGEHKLFVRVACFKNGLNVGKLL